MRRLALALLICIIAASLTAQIVIITNANHDCIGDGCPICKLIHNAEMLLKQIGRILISISVIYEALLIIPMAMIMIGLLCIYFSTPVKAKVRLNH